MSEEQKFSLKELAEILAKQQELSDKRAAENLKTVITELRKPTVLEQKALDDEAAKVKAANEERKENAKGMLQQIADRKLAQRICSHQAPDGHTHCVEVKGNNGQHDYILCQKCQGKVAPGVAPENYKGDFMYDTALYNRLYQTLPSGHLLGY